jgi:hypothetical protein
MIRHLSAFLTFLLLAAVPLAAAPDPLAISNVNASATPEAIAVSWVTNLPSTSLVEWGTSKDNLPFNKADKAYVTNHNLTLTGLTPGTVYYIVITSVGQQGESVHYTVSQPKPAPAPAPAPSPAPPPVHPTSAAADDDGWHFGFEPYLWFPAMHGTTGTTLHPVGVHASAGDVLSHFNIGLMGAYEVRKKRFLYVGDLMWVKLGDDKAGYIEDRSITADAKMYNLFFSQELGLRVVDSPKLKIDGLGGFRYWYLSTDLNVVGDFRELSVNATQTWLDPIVGSRIMLPLSKRAAMTIYGDVGGWNTGSKLEYQVVGTLGYHVKPSIVLEGGWRYFYVDYEGSLSQRGAFLYKMYETGPVLGIRFNVK